MVFILIELTVDAYNEGGLVLTVFADDESFGAEARVPEGCTLDDFSRIEVYSEDFTLGAVYVKPDGSERVVRLKANKDGGDVFPQLEDIKNYCFGTGLQFAPEAMYGADLRRQPAATGPQRYDSARFSGILKPWFTTYAKYPEEWGFCTGLYVYLGEVDGKQKIWGATEDALFEANLTIGDLETSCIEYETDPTNEVTQVRGYPIGQRDLATPYTPNYEELPGGKGIKTINGTERNMCVSLKKEGEPEPEPEVEVPPQTSITLSLPEPDEGEPSLSEPLETNLDCLEMDATMNSVTLQWQSTSGLTYKLFRDNNLIAEKEGNNFLPPDNILTAKDTGLLPDVSYNYELVVCDVDSNIVARDFATCTTICILPGATVLTPNGKKLIDDIRAGDVVIDENGNHVTVTHNIRSGPSKRKVVRFDKGCFGSQKPDAPITITTGHPIKRRPNTKEAVVESYINHGLIQSRFMKLSHTFTLMTKQRCFVMTNGIPVATYSEADFEKECQKMRAAGTPLLYQLL